MSPGHESLPVRPASPPRAPGPTPWANRLALMAVLSIVLGPVSFGFIPSEIARWHAAAAQEADWSKDYDGAVEQLDKAIAWDSDNVSWWLRRAQVHGAYEKYDLALADCDVAVQIDPENVMVLLARCNAALRMKRFDEVERDLKKAQELAAEQGYPEGTLDNEVAYLQAVANRDLENSLKLADRALTNHREGDSLLASLMGDGQSREIAILDTRGYVYLQLGKATEARADFDQAVNRGKIWLAQAQAALKKSSTDSRQYEHDLEQAKKTLAVMTYHRSLALDKLGLPVEAALDREEVRRLGFTPDENLF